MYSTQSQPVLVSFRECDLSFLSEVDVSNSFKVKVTRVG